MASKSGNHGDGMGVDAQLKNLSLKNNPEKGGRRTTGGSTNQVRIAPTQKNTLVIQETSTEGGMSASAPQRSFGSDGTHQQKGDTHYGNRCHHDSNYGGAPEMDRPEREEPQVISEEIQRLKYEKRRLTAAEKSALQVKIGEKWRMFGRGLGLTDAQLYEIKHDFDEGLHETIYQILHKWECTNGNAATVGSLVQVMIDMKIVDVIEKVFDL